MNVLSECKKAAEICGSDEISRLVELTEAKLSEEHRPTVVILTDRFSAADLIKITEPICGEAVKKLFAGESVNVLIRGGNKAMLPPFVHIGKYILVCAESKYAPTDVIVCYGADYGDGIRDLIECADKVILMTNTGMALPETEKSWLKNFGSRLGGERLAVYAYGTNNLSGQSDIDAVYDYISAITAKTSGSVLRSPEKISDFVKELESLPDKYSEMRKEFIINDLRNDVSNILKMILEKNNEIFDISAESAEKLKNYKAQFDISGKIASENEVKLFYNGIKSDLLSGMELYCENMKKIIAERVSTSEDPANEKIGDYVICAWDHYVEHAAMLTYDKQLTFVRRIQDDLSAEIDRLSKVVNIDFEELITVSDIKMDTNTGKKFYVENNDEKITQKNVRTIMLTAIPLFLINPFCGAAAAACAGIYKVSQKRKVSDELRIEIINSAAAYCEEVKHTLFTVLCDKIDSAADESAGKISAVYAAIIDKVVYEINRINDKTEKINEQKKALEEIGDRLCASKS